MSCHVSMGNNKNGKKEPGADKNKQNGTASPAYRPGDNPAVRTTIVLSAPGNAEARAGRPAAGQTGKNLQLAIEELSRRNPQRFPSDKLDDYTLINAVPAIHSANTTGRTEGRDDEIKKPENIRRLQKVINGADCVVALGKKAETAVTAAGYNGPVFKSLHPSMQAINRQYKSKKKTPKARNRDRIQQWARDVLKSTA